MWAVLSGKMENRNRNYDVVFLFKKTEINDGSKSSLLL